jgi:hypothetical protein
LAERTSSYFQIGYHPIYDELNTLNQRSQVKNQARPYQMTNTDEIRVHPKDTQAAQHQHKKPGTSTDMPGEVLTGK